MENEMTIDHVLERLVIREPHSLETGCWDYPTNINSHGYARISLGVGRAARAHRFVYEHFKGVIPDGMHLHHLCGNRRCCNINHLQPIAPSMHPLIGDTFCAREARQTHCKRGHPFDGPNTIRTATGGRNCRACARERRAARHQRDMALKMDSPSPPRTHCKRGHPYPVGSQRCPQCRKALERRHEERRKENRRALRLEKAARAVGK